MKGRTRRKKRKRRNSPQTMMMMSSMCRRISSRYSCLTPLGRTGHCVHQNSIDRYQNSSPCTLPSSSQDRSWSYVMHISTLAYVRISKAIYTICEATVIFEPCPGGCCKQATAATGGGQHHMPRLSYFFNSTGFWLGRSHGRNLFCARPGHGGL